MAITNKDIITAIEGMKIAELNELVKEIEKHFDVVASAVAAAPAADGANDGAPTEVNVVLTDAGQSKVAVIKLVGQLTGKGLMDSKKLVESLPAVIKEKVKTEEAEEIKQKLIDAGASVDLK
ncbi:50S ribosomal protein L7/L12 [Spiroplasma endosymbiont of Amphibalanus improvisus]|uniref:50S ribosomal protein L7/L12 n=1 Tax=Spiroplasma endosymbiont of Amphibalanus improvisus TaxID=3066327 RepID=UPI00313AD233